MLFSLWQDIRLRRREIVCVDQYVFVDLWNSSGKVAAFFFGAEECTLILNNTFDYEMETTSVFVLESF